MKRKKKLTTTILTILMIGLLSTIFISIGCSPKNSNLNKQNYTANANKNGSSEQNTNKGGAINVKDYPKQSLSQSEISALKEAIEDEYKARDIYNEVMKKFGKVRPFVNIEKAEEMHISMLEDLFKKYGLPIPKDDMASEAKKIVSNINTLTEACKAGVQGEIENYDMYDRLFKQVDNKDIIAVFTALRDASQYRHLPAFKRCAGTN